MEVTDWHLVLNHFPILGTLFGALILAGGIIWRKNQVMVTGLIMLVIMAVITPVVSQTGSEAEEVIEELGIEESYIEEHEELAELATPLMSILGLLSLVSIYGIVKQTKYRRVLNIITLVGAIGIFGLMVQIANLGGQIRHSEIRQEVSSPGSTTDHEGEGGSEEHYEDDD